MEIKNIKTEILSMNKYSIKENEMEASTSNEYIVLHHEKEEDFFLR